jgi:hypothetical protein
MGVAGRSRVSIPPAGVGSAAHILAFRPLLEACGPGVEFDAHVPLLLILEKPDLNNLGRESWRFARPEPALQILLGTSTVPVYRRPSLTHTAV